MWSGWLLPALVAAALSGPARRTTYELQVLPAEHRRLQDPVSGADLLFVTTGPATDNNLYFHERSFLADESMLLFTSNRKPGGLMGYLFATGELVLLATPGGGLGSATAARVGPRYYALRGNQVLEVTVRIKASPDPSQHPSTVTQSERLLAVLPPGMGAVTSLNENANGCLLSLGVNLPEGECGIAVIDVKAGGLRVACRIAADDFAGHVQFSRTDPNTASYAGKHDRLMVVDVRTGAARAAYRALPGELVTHEVWWVHGQLLFCGGHRDGESHVKLLDRKSGVARIVGAGSWWEGATPAQLAKWNWWHPAGDDAGRWVAADNWHGDIAIFDAATTQMHRLTLGHRTYGGGDHPHVGWDRQGRRVVFTSHLLGGSHVCVATLPERWPAEKGWK